jgi:hypothetical protein
MSTAVAEALFLLAFWAPPLAVLAGALLLLMPTPHADRTVMHTHGAPLAHR